ncbi:MAG: DUF192 domain-containing protein [Alphaproteobacteria bacterium]
MHSNKNKTNMHLCLPAVMTAIFALIVFLYFNAGEQHANAQEVVKIPPRITPADDRKNDDDNAEEARPQKLQSSEIKIITQDDTNLVYTVELARTAEEKRIGMMYRSNVPAGTGMLFIFDEPQEHSFWMKNTWVALDLLFLLDDGTIHHIHHNAQPRSLDPIPSQGEVLHVLEIGGGEAKRLGIEVGDRVVIN